jgi:hypothetical protein
VLIANKGAASVSVDANYGGKGPSADAAKAAVTDLARQVLSKVTP